MDRGLKVVVPFLVMIGRLNQGEASRLGIIASKRLGGAVQRNRAKRRLRELFRNSPRPGSHLDLVVIARAGIGEAPFPLLQQAYQEALDKLEVKLIRASQRSP